MAAKSRSQTPSFDPREKRTKTLFQLPKEAGRSRQGEPVRAGAGQPEYRFHKQPVIRAPFPPFFFFFFH